MLARVDLHSGTVSWPYKGFDSPAGVAISPDGTYAIVANYGGGTEEAIGCINLETGAIMKTSASPGLLKVSAVAFRHHGNGEREQGGGEQLVQHGQRSAPCTASILALSFANPVVHDVRIALDV